MDNNTLRTTTARLRRTFAYPTDDSSTSGGTPEVLDEEEQETLIAALAEQNAQRNTQFRSLLYLLPALSSVPYLLSPFARAPFPPLGALLALTSLASTAYLLRRLPPAATGMPWLDRWVARPDGGADESGGGEGESESERRRRRPSSFSFAELADHRSPLETWLPYLNVGLCVAVAMLGLAGGERGGGGLLGLGTLPALVYGVVTVAKSVMAGVDPERELGGLRYEYKGA